jgi:hypothetical protein
VRVCVTLLLAKLGCAAGLAALESRKYKLAAGLYELR